MYTYIAGDNNLSDAGLVDIREMEAVGASKDAHVAVQIDTAGEHDGSVRYEIGEPDFGGKAHRTVIDRLPEQDTGNPRFLADFIGWAAGRYPAAQRLLVVWNHGAGFMHTPTKDIGYDDSSGGDALTMAELRWALGKAGFGGSGASGRLAILGFDACLMNMVEVAYEFTGFTEFIVGSQQTEPGDGWPYSEVVRSLRGGAAAKQVAIDIVKAYIASYRQTGTSGVTQSALHVDALAGVADAVDALGGALLPTLAQGAGRVLEARVATLGYEEPTYVDLADLSRRLEAKIADAKVKAACAAVRAAIGKAVIANGSLGASVKGSSGLSIWFPLLKGDYVTRRSEYVALRFSSDHRKWSAFLDALLAA
jgi:hypothetical protein